MNQNRRKFLKQAGLASAAMMVASKLPAAPAGNTVGLQLYTLRDQLPKDVKGWIGKVAAAGYKEVEPFGYSKKGGFWGMDAHAFSALLKANGLTTASAHFDMDQYFSTGKTDDLQSYIEAAKITGMSYIIVPSVDESHIKTAADFKTIADKLNAIGAICQKEGLKVGYHNHNFEWKSVDGTTFYDVVMKVTDPG